MTVPEYDALIVGARVAGSSVAARLARQGRKVLLVDRDSFPSDTISTHFLSFNAVDALRRLEVLDRIEAAGFRRIHRHRAWIDDICIEVPAGPPGTYSIAPRRIVLDQVLADRAVECGAELVQRARVDGLLTENGAVVGAAVQHIGGEKREVRARVVVGADGKHSQIASWVGAEKYDERPVGRPIYYGYFSGVSPLADPAIEMFFGSDHIGFCFPMRADEHCLILEAQPEEFEAIRQNPEGWLRSQYETLPGMAERTRHAKLDGRILGTRGVENFFRKPYGPGWALTGDAAYVKDPCTGYGIGDALIQSFLLARSIGAWLDGAAWEPTMESYHQRRDVALRAMYEQTVAATAARDEPYRQLNALRAVLVNQHDTRRLIRGLPGMLDQLFEPMDRMRHAFIAELYETAVDAPV
ncbi:MAG TPA: NAD(P)/FAD-dependent oxidoreductase [Candidatus Limnocylindrales bacterium]|nr:NAD(P)/FAD-dependent oxidoreductase [Candidatus Limnocylindrales bacterium]